MKIIKVAGIFLLFILIIVDIASACLPGFDDAYLPPQKFLAIPKGKFWYELNRLSGKEIEAECEECECSERSTAFRRWSVHFENTSEKHIFDNVNIIREVNSELGVLKLNRKEYISALDFLLVELIDCK